MKKAFTLLELLLVIAIIASLAGLILIALNPAQRLEEANQTKYLSNANDLEKAIDAYVLANSGLLPPEIQTKVNKGISIMSICKSGQICDGIDLSNSLINNEYISEIPVNKVYETNTYTGMNLVYNPSNQGINIEMADWGGVSLSSNLFTSIADFSIDIPAPIQHQIQNTPNVGSIRFWPQNDPNYSLVNIQNGLLNLGPYSTGTKVWASLDQSVFESNINGDLVGNALASRIKFTGTDQINWYHVKAGTPIHPSGGWSIAANGTLSAVWNYTYPPTGTVLTPGSWVEGIFIYRGRSVGTWQFTRIQGNPNWRMSYVFTRPGYGNNFAHIDIQPVTANSKLEISTLRAIVGLPAPFNDSYGLATQRLSGTRTVGDTFVHEADGWFEWFIATRPTSGIASVRFREQDDNNYWRVNVNSSGDLSLDEIISGISTQRGVSTGKVISGEQVKVLADRNTIYVYENDTLRITYSAAISMATETNGRLESTGTEGVVSEIVTWPLYMSGQTKAILHAIMAK